MKRVLFLGLALLLGGTLALALLSGPARYAIAAVGPELGWYSVDGGGVISATGSQYALGGTVGQPDAGTLAGGSYVLNGGFWGGYQDPAVAPTATPPAPPVKFTQILPFVQR